MVPITAGQSPQFRFTPEPAGIPTSIDRIAWAVSFDDGSSDSTIDPNDDDQTGQTATVEMGPTVTKGATMTIEIVYTNLSGSYYSQSWQFSVE